MKKLWKYIDNKKWQAHAKYKYATFILCTLSALAGFILWLILKIPGFSSPKWLFCYIGYPIVIAFIAAFIYSCNHEFKDN
ncbi:MAG: hypothetical protein K6G40_01460 [Eubacterium sp.]|nr:hypothetical protein [Eubacterium sp.]